MQDKSSIVIDTGALLALIAATRELALLQVCFSEVLVPLEVSQEIETGGSSGFGVDAFVNDSFLTKISEPTRIVPYLESSLDPGEAAVIQTALDRGISTVCIDETAGRHVARMCKLSVTGSIGILISAKQMGHPIELGECIDQMKQHGIWISEALIQRIRNWT